jgi:hypothetical protein
MDDILLIFDSNVTDVQPILTDFKALHPNLMFTAEVKVEVKQSHYRP